jgi:hypothetical protein
MPPKPSRWLQAADGSVAEHRLLSPSSAEVRTDFRRIEVSHDNPDQHLRRDSFKSVAVQEAHEDWAWPNGPIIGQCCRERRPSVVADTTASTAPLDAASTIVTSRGPGSSRRDRVGLEGSGRVVCPAFSFVVAAPTTPRQIDTGNGQSRISVISAAVCSVA